MILVAIASIVLFGAVSYTRLGLDQLPEITVPVVTVLVPYPGAGPREVEEQVTRKLEDGLAGLSDVEEISSVSSQNLATISVKFRESVDIDLVALEVERTVNNLRRELPTEVEAPTTRKVDLNDQPILYLALTSAGGRDPTELFRIADDQIRPRLESLEGISAARVLGGRKPEIQVAVDPDRLRAFRLSVGDVAQALANQYQTVTGGTVRGGLADADREFALRIEGRDRDPSTLGSLTVSGRDGVSTELRNVAEISDAGADQAAIVRLNNRDAIGVLVSKQAQANITQAADRALAELQAINAGLPSGLALEIIVDRSDFIRSSVRDVQKELGIAALLTGVVLLLFLHTLRATIIVLVAIPTCVLATFIVMQLAGLTLNILSLLGLTTSIGILVDDSIVVLENIFRKLEEGEEPKTAAVNGRNEIGLAAIAITLVDVVVYGPIVFLSGTTGGFLRNFAIVVAATTLSSLLVSFTLTPMLASRWLGAQGPGPRQKRSLLSRVASSWEPLYRATERGYGRFLGWSLRHRPIILIGSIGIFAASFLMVPLIGAEFVPDIDGPFIAMSGELPGGATLEASDRAARLWEQRLLDHTRFPEVRKVYMVVGAGSTDLDRGARYLSVIVELEPRLERPVDASTGRRRTSSQIRREALQVSQGIAGLTTSIGGNRPGGAGQALQV
ncbi:MAG: efflux RND transporter permease subunit, partial [Actinobacteria bacterium]|nr:efflux RND transporter permease subunit [Actinomycetota bacterium]